MTLHPSFRMLARFDEPVRGWEGSLQSAFSDAFMAEGLTLVSLFLPVGVIAATMPGIGKEHARRAADIDKMSVFGGLVHDEGGGVVRRAPLGREPIVTYRMTPANRAMIPKVLRKMAGIYFAAGARSTTCRCSAPSRRQPTRWRPCRSSRCRGAPSSARRSTRSAPAAWGPIRARRWSTRAADRGTPRTSGSPTGASCRRASA
ncbi:MAG: hypothetical protein U1F43_34605 [Myxococcota bacterium]